MLKRCMLRGVHMRVWMRWLRLGTVIVFARADRRSRPETCLSFDSFWILQASRV